LLSHGRRGASGTAVVGCSILLVGGIGEFWSLDFFARCVGAVEIHQCDGGARAPRHGGTGDQRESGGAGGIARPESTAGFLVLAVCLRGTRGGADGARLAGGGTSGGFIFGSTLDTGDLRGPAGHGDRHVSGLGAVVAVGV